MTKDIDLAKFLTQERHDIHLVGVAGSGMSGIAGLLLQLGHQVSGSDKLDSLETDRLQRLGLKFYQQHRAADARDAELVIYSSAIKKDNPILKSAQENGKRTVRRAEALAAIMAAKRGILVVGMHGKTTTSAMSAHVLREGGLHPSHYVGAEIPILGTNAHWDGRGDFFVAEGDESDGTIALFHPEHALILNIEEEHLDFYADLTAIEKVFRQLLAQTTGKVFYCADEPNATRICRSSDRVVCYGLSDEADYRATDIELRDFSSVFSVYRGKEKLGEAVLNVPGEHNVRNALGVIALATELGVAFEKIAKSLTKFQHARRRFEIKYDSPRVVITDVYGSNESPMPGVTGQLIVDEIAAHGHCGVSYQPRLEWVHRDVGNLLESGDLVLSLGAGNIHEQLSILAADLVIAEKLKEIVGEGGDVRLYEPLSKHTTLRVGGPAQFWVEPRNETALSELIRFCRRDNLPLFVIGRGSNLLVRDGGIRGVVVHPSGGNFDKIDIHGNEITAGVGAKLKEIAYAARAADLGGLEWMEGIPGAVGGALRMNAGAMGAQTFEKVVRVRYLDGEGNAHDKNRDELEVHYRHFPLLEQNFAVSATFRGSPAPREQIESRLRESQEKRRTTQPIAKSAGCIFKNPEKCPAGKLVDELGLKNSSIGKARVSEVHGNFIVNDGGATATEMLELIDRIKQAAKTKRGIELETEVQIVGEPA